MVNVVEVKRSAIESVTLELDRGELAWLCTVLCRTGGSPRASFRQHADSVNFALLEQGIESSKLARHDLIEKHSNGGGSGNMYWLDGGV